MKKVLMGLMILSNLCFGDWGAVESKDEFGDKTGAIGYIGGINPDTPNYFLQMENPDELTIKYFKPKFKAVKNKVVTKFKIDNKEPYTVTTKNESSIEGSSVIVGTYKVEDKNIVKKIVSDFKSGKLVKIVIVDDNGKNNLITIPLTNFSTSYEKLVKQRTKK